MEVILFNFNPRRKYSLMSIIINDEEITEDQILHIIEMLKKENDHDCQCGGHHHDQDHDCQCGGHHDDEHDHDDFLVPSESELRNQAEAFLIQNLLIKQHVMATIPESSKEEIQAFIALRGERYQDIADLSVRMDKFSIQLDSLVNKPTHDEVFKFYQDNREDMVDEDDVLIPFEDLEEELTEELFDELKNANFEYQLKQLLDKAKIEYK